MHLTENRDDSVHWLILSSAVDYYPQIKSMIYKDGGGGWDLYIRTWSISSPPSQSEDSLEVTATVWDNIDDGWWWWHTVLLLLLLLGTWWTTEDVVAA